MNTRSLLLAFVALAALVSPHAHAADKPLRQLIDDEIQAAWRREKITPARPATDSVFLRRVYLDLVGMVPSHDETTAFLNDKDARKREKLIDKLLDDPRFPRQQAHAWDLVLFGRRPQNIDATRNRDDFLQWLAGQFTKNERYDRWVQKLLLAEEDGSQLFHVQYRNQTEELTTAVSRIFLGTQLQCARCHDHPFEAWTQKDFYGMAGFFVRLVVVDAPADKGKKKYRIGEKSTGDVMFAGSVKELKPGQKGEPVKPKFLGGADLAEPPLPKDFKEAKLKGNELPPKPQFSRKEKVVAWLTAADNPYFAQAVANRLWSQFMGRGLVHPVDDLSTKNAPSHPALFKILSEDIRARGFETKGFIRELVNTQTYQLGDAGPLADALPAWFERARVRPLSAEELMASFRVATGHDSAMPKGTADVEYMLRYFGEPHDGQGNFQASIAEHLFLNNAGQIRALAQPNKGNLAERLLKDKSSWEERVDRLFLSVLSRPPAADERQHFVQHLTSDAKMTSALIEEAVWVLLSCAEFRFNH